MPRTPERTPSRLKTLNYLASQPGSKFLRRPGHRPEESARWYIRSARGVEYRIPQEVAEIQEARFQDKVREMEEEYVWNQLSPWQKLQSHLRAFRLRVSEFLARHLPRLKARLRRFAGAIVGLWLGLLVAASCATLKTVNSEPVFPVLDRTESVEVVLDNRSHRQEVVRVYDRSGFQLDRLTIPAVSADTVTVDLDRERGIEVELRHLAGNETVTLNGRTVEPGDVVFVNIHDRPRQSNLSVYPVGQDFWLARYDHPETLLTAGLERITPPDRWLRWYEDAAECANVESDPEGATWFVFDAAVLSGIAIEGLYEDSADHVYIRSGAARDTNLVRHEAIHRILVEQGFPIERNAAHDTTLFQECAPRNPRRS